MNKPSNPKPNRILPPHDPSHRHDHQDLLAGAKLLIRLGGATDPESKAQLAALNEYLFKPAEDDLRRIDILVTEGLTVDEAWEELDRIKRQAGIKPE